MNIIEPKQKNLNKFKEISTNITQELKLILKSLRIN